MIDHHFIGGTGRCLSCGAEMTAATNVNGNDMPEVGDATVCLYCGHLMIFALGLALRQPTDQEIVELAGNANLLKAMRVSGAFRNRNKR